MSRDFTKTISYMEKSRYKTIMINMKIIRSSFTDTWNIINMSTYCRDDHLVECSSKKGPAGRIVQDKVSAPPQSESFL